MLVGITVEVPLVTAPDMGRLCTVSARWRLVRRRAAREIIIHKKTNQQRQWGSHLGVAFRSAAPKHAHPQRRKTEVMLGDDVKVNERLQSENGNFRNYQRMTLSLLYNTLYIHTYCMVPYHIVPHNETSHRPPTGPKPSWPLLEAQGEEGQAIPRYQERGGMQPITVYLRKRRGWSAYLLLPSTYVGRSSLLY